MHVRFVSKRHALTTDGWVVRGVQAQGLCCAPSLFPVTGLPRAGSLAANNIGSDAEDKLRSDHPNIQFEF